MYEDLIRILQQAGLGEDSDIPNIPRIAPVSRVTQYNIQHNIHNNVI